MYEAHITFLDAILSPHDYPQLASPEGNWNWDSDTRVKTQGPKVSLSSFQTLADFLSPKMSSMKSKLLLQSFRSGIKTSMQPIYKTVDAVIDRVKAI